MSRRRIIACPGTHDAFSNPTTRQRVEGRPDSRALETQHSLHDCLGQTNVVLASVEKPNTFFYVDLEKSAEASREIGRLAPEMLESEHSDVIAPQSIDEDSDRARIVEVVRKFVPRDDRFQPLIARRRTKKTEAFAPDA